MRKVQAADREAWRAWLRKHAQHASEIWLVFYKKHTGRPCVSYDHAVEEALCFGWIDGKVMRLDESRYVQRFTPRGPKSRWADSNMRRVKKMIALGKMTAAGLAAYRPEQRIPAPALPTRLPADLERSFKRARRAWANFGALPPYYRKYAIGWVASAKKEETRRRRLERLIETAARNERLPFI